MLPAMLGLMGTAFGSALGFGSNVLSNSTNWNTAQLNAQLQRETNDLNYRIAQETNQANRDIAEQTNWYNRELQDMQWQRDDTAYSRMVQDMSNAGLNPLSGGSPVSSPLTTQMQGAQIQSARMDSPQYDYRNVPYDFSGLTSGLLDSLGKSLQYNLQDKALNIQAIRSGIDPKLVNSNEGDPVLDVYKAILSNQLKILRKDASNPHSKGDSAVKQIIDDVDTLFGDIGIDTGRSTIPLRSVPKETVKSVKGIKVVDSGSTDQYRKDVNDYYYNKAHKIRQSNNPLDNMRRFLRGKRWVK